MFPSKKKKRGVKKQKNKTNKFSTSLSLAGNLGCLTWATAAAKAVLPIPSRECSILTSPNNNLAAVLGIFHVCTDVDACDCTQVLYGHHKGL